MDAGMTVIGFCDDDPDLWGAQRLGLPVTRPDPGRDCLIALGVGQNAARQSLAARLVANGYTLTSVVHPAAVVDSRARMGVGGFVAAGAIVGVKAEIGDGVVVNTGASVDHDCRIAAFSHISPGVHLGGGVTVGTGAWLGIGSSVREGMVIGSWAIVGAGSVVVRDVPAGVTAFGCPARVRSVHGPAGDAPEADQ
jgi:sugar O-acyltransferase (sialic acid O-acetyltransferase NeuD family)